MCLKEIMNENHNWFFDRHAIFSELFCSLELRSPVGHIISLDKNCIPMEQNKAPIPPNFQKYLAWGFPDHSIRICSFESDRPVTVYELRDEDEVLV